MTLYFWIHPTGDVRNFLTSLGSAHAQPIVIGRPVPRGKSAAGEIEVAHSIEVVVICDTGRAIAGAEFGAKVEFGFNAAVDRSAGK